MLAFVFDSVSFSEWFVLLVVFLIVVGPRKIPETARTLGNYYSKFRRAAESFKRQLLEMETEFNKAAADVEKDVSDTLESDGDESEAEPMDESYYDPEAAYPGQADFPYDDGNDSPDGESSGAESSAEGDAAVSEQEEKAPEKADGAVPNKQS